MRLINGKYIIIHELNAYFEHVTHMLLEHFDLPNYSNVLFSVGTYTKIPIQEIKYNFPNKKIIVYQLEQLMSGCGNHLLVSQILDNIKYADEIWDYDILNIEYLKEYNIKVDRLLPLLYTTKLDNISSLENPEIDVLFYGWINDRRSRVFLDLQSVLYNQLKIVWVYGESAIDKYIANSKVILNIHAYEPWNRQEQVRMFYPLINGKTNVSETSQINYMAGEIIESDLPTLGESLVEVCNSDKWKIFGKLAKEKFKERTNKYLLNSL
jgi:hypothetical protein